MREMIRSLWADELESGKYTQVRDVLMRADEARGGGRCEVCADGVLCLLAQQAGVVTYRWGFTEDGTHALFGDREEGSLVPEEVQRWAELDAEPRIDFSQLDEELLNALRDEILADDEAVPEASQRLWDAVATRGWADTAHLNDLGVSLSTIGRAVRVAAV